jgi:hypothetical protein
MSARRIYIAYARQRRTCFSLSSRLIRISGVSRGFSLRSLRLCEKILVCGNSSLQFFTAGPEWKHYSFPISPFRTDGSDLNTLIFLRARHPESSGFEIDEVEFR